MTGRSSSHPSRLWLAIPVLTLASALVFALQGNTQRIESQDKGEAPKTLVLEAKFPPGIKLIDVRGAHKRDWYKHLEVVIKNESSIAVTYMEVYVAMPELVIRQARLAFTLTHGDIGVRKGRPNPYPSERLEAGKSAILRIDPVELERLEEVSKPLGMHLSDVTRLVFNVHRVYFADGSSYIASKRFVKTSSQPQRNKASDKIAKTGGSSIAGISVSFLTLAPLVDTSAVAQACPGSCEYRRYQDPDCPCSIDQPPGEPCLRDCVESANASTGTCSTLTNQYNTRCINGDQCDNYVITPCDVCDYGESNPHFTCIGGNCFEADFCGASTGGCTQAGNNLCDCSEGTQRPHYICASNGNCSEQSWCGSNSGGCTGSTGTCTPPCEFPKTQPFKKCDSEYTPSKCVLVEDDCQISTCFGIPGCQCNDGTCYSPPIESGGCVAYDAYCSCETLGLINAGSCCCITTPIIIDTNGDGYKLTSLSNGVNFDFNGDGIKGPLSWTAPNSDDAFLVLDRNKNGRIDTGAELFGNSSPQPESRDKNGFLALAEFDKLSNGGDENGRIDRRDQVFSRLQLWQDLNHNGISEPSELRGLAAFGVGILDLEYKLSKRKDEYGNQFKYRAKLRSSMGSDIGKWAWDVGFLMKSR